MGATILYNSTDIRLGHYKFSSSHSFLSHLVERKQKKKTIIVLNVGFDSAQTYELRQMKCALRLSSFFLEISSETLWLYVYVVSVSKIDVCPLNVFYFENQTGVCNSLSALSCVSWDASIKTDLTVSQLLKCTMKPLLGPVSLTKVFGAEEPRKSWRTYPSVLCLHWRKRGPWQFLVGFLFILGTYMP